jgi:hypothetical protein
MDGTSPIIILEVKHRAGIVWPICFMILYARLIHVYCNDINRVCRNNARTCIFFFAIGLFTRRLVRVRLRVIQYILYSCTLQCLHI